MMSHKTLFWDHKHRSCNDEGQKVQDPVLFPDGSCILLNMDWTPLSTPCFR